MMRLIIFLLFVFSQAYKGVVYLKDEFITILLYFIVLFPFAMVKKSLPGREKKFLARRNSWVKIK